MFFSEICTNPGGLSMSDSGPASSRMQDLDKPSQAFIEGLAQPGKPGPDTPETRWASS